MVFHFHPDLKRNYFSRGFPHGPQKTAGDPREETIFSEAMFEVFNEE